MIDEPITDQLATVRDYLRWGASRMAEAGIHFGHGTNNAFDEARDLVLWALHLPHDTDASVLDARLTLRERERVVEVLRRRVVSRVPAPYITGVAWFAGVPFVVDERVIIPRSPIAELIEKGFAPWLGHEPERVLDLCAGSGCIGIACALYLADADVDLVDISADALACAAENVDRHGLADRIRLIESDLFGALTPGEDRYDLIVSNPPYVDAAGLAAMPAEYRHEPNLALAAGDDGLDLARRILREAPAFLTDDGVLVLEVGNSGMALEESCPEVPFTWVEFERGGHGVLVMTAAELARHRESFV